VPNPCVTRARDPRQGRWGDLVFVLGLAACSDPLSDTTSVESGEGGRGAAESVTEAGRDAGYVMVGSGGAPPFFPRDAAADAPAPDLAPEPADGPSPEAGPIVPEAGLANDGGAEGSAPVDRDDASLSDGGRVDAGPGAPEAGPLPCGASYSPWETGPLAMPGVGTLVVAGDSISSTTAATSYPALLRDALRARYGTVAYAHVAVAGAVSTDVPGQIANLTEPLPGPVVVALTIGGNDWKNYFADALAGKDVPPVETIFENMDATLAYILEPGRFGPGVEAHVVQANVYDPADGLGNYAEFGCGYSGLPDGINFDAVFAFLNDNVYAVVTGRDQTVLDLWGLFRHRGYNYDPTWFKDCLHPNTVGHEHLRRRFYCLITGEAYSVVE
jgi:hypothetical protein